MQLIPIKTPLIQSGDDLGKILSEHGSVQSGDIVVISSKVVATAEGAAIRLSDLSITDEARAWAKKCGNTPQFRQAVLNETKRMNGTILEGCPEAMLTELKPAGLAVRGPEALRPEWEEGTILAVNAGLDSSNCEEGYAVGWPIDPVKSVGRLRKELIERASGQWTVDSGQWNIGIILSDSCCRPRRLGVTAIALVASGFDPLQSQIGKEDLFGKELKMTFEATADQLATATNILMGNADQRIPAVIIRDHGMKLCAFEGWVSGIEREKDLFRGM